MRSALLTAVLLSTATLVPACASAQQTGAIGGRPAQPAGQTLPEPEAANYRVAGAIVEPRSVKPSPETLARLQVPAGFKVNVFADGLGNARLLAVAADGTAYLTRRAEGDVMMLRDTDGDGRADVVRQVARRPGMHGIAISGSTVYLAAQKEILRTTILPDGSLAPLEVLTADLPDAGQHSARSVVVGPDGMLYLGVGSTCNACTETSPESATVLRMTPDGKSRTIYASGLRHTIGMDWQPRSGQLWGMDHGIDWLGDEQQPEELNRIEMGKSYGWPYIYGFGGENPQVDPPNKLTMAELNAASTKPVLGYTAHAAPMQFQFYRGAMFPRSYQGDAFVTMRGSWNREKPSGYEVARVRFDPSGNATAFEPFLWGFLDTGSKGPSQSGRPVGLATAADGALLFTDDINGVIYRVTYAGADRAGAMLPPPAPRSADMEPRPKGTALANMRGETRTSAPLRVMSPTFAANGPIPTKLSAYGDDISPALIWEDLPAGANYLALLMEDPDAQTGLPFVHWVAWNIPAGLGSLPEGLSKELQLADPKGMRQGRNTRGSVGYFGPRPPIGDKPHRYNFQVFALSAPLNLQIGANREQLLAALENKVIARGTVVGTYAQPAPPPKR